MLREVPEGLTAASAAMEALASRMAAAHTGAAPAVTAVIPPAADAVSLQTAAGFSARASQQQAVAAQAVEDLGRSGVGVGDAGISYATGDGLAASSYLIARG
jgi:hypothetical protein